MYRKRVLGLAALTGLLGAGVPAVAQQAGAPDAGTILRDLRSGTPARTPQAPPRGAGKVVIPAEGPKFLLKDVVADGASLLTAEQLRAAYADYLGRELTAGQLKELAARVADAYRDSGYFARVLVPPQDVTDGVVRLIVVEGRFGSARMVGDGGRRIDNEYVVRVVTQRLKPGQPYSMADLERGVLLANDLAGTRVDASLEAGVAAGTSDLAVAIRDLEPVDVSVGATNYGSKSTGSIQSSATMAFNGVAGLGDRLLLVTSLSDGMKYGRGDYNAPIGTSGLRGSVSVSTLRYSLVGAFEKLGASGRATTFSADLRYPVIRAEATNFWVTAALERTHYADFALGDRVHDKVVSLASIGLAFDHFDQVLGGGQTQFSLRLADARLDLDRMPIDKLLDGLGPRAQGHTSLVRWEIRRAQTLNWFDASGLYARVSLAGQLASGNLDSSLKFSLGGASGVRGYPSGEAAGDHGAIGSTELHKRFDRVDAYVFLDAGVVWQHAEPWVNWDSGSGQANRYRLQSAGLGASYVLPAGQVLSVTVARPVGSHAGSQAGKNQDGTQIGTRVWASLNASF